MREELHERVKQGSEISASDIERVNPSSRLARMKDETRMLIDAIEITKGESAEKKFRELDRYDFLAVDWVTGQEIEWEGSAPARCAQGIRTMTAAL